MSLADLPKAFLLRYGETGFYRPLVTLAHSLDALLYGHWAPGYHITNVLLHLAVTAAAYLFLSAFFELPKSGSLVGALVVGIHPAGWLPVGAISYRPELLAALFTLLAVSLHVRARQSGSRLCALFAILCCFLGLLSKETVLVWFPGLIATWELLHLSKRKTRQEAPRLFQALWLIVGEALVIGLYLLLRVLAVPELWRVSPIALALSSALGTRLAVVGKSLLQLASPLRPPLSDATRIVGLTSLASLVTAAALVAVCATILRLGLGSPWARVLFFLGIALAPTLNIVPLPRFSSPHYGYFAVVGVAAAAALASRLISRGRQRERTAALALASLWMLIMAGSTFAGGFRFRDDYRLFSREVARDPLFLEGHQYLGDFFLARGEHRRAAQEYRAALERTPGVVAYVDRRAVLVNLAGALMLENQFEEADTLLQQAAENAPRKQSLYILYDRALIAARQGDPARVVALLADTQLEWERPEPLLLLARSLRHLGRDREAMEALRKCLPLLPPQQRREVEEVLSEQK